MGAADPRINRRARCGGSCSNAQACRALVASGSDRFQHIAGADLLAPALGVGNDLGHRARADQAAEAFGEAFEQTAVLSELEERDSELAFGEQPLRIEVDILADVRTEDPAQRPALEACVFEERDDELQTRVLLRVERSRVFGDIKPCMLTGPLVVARLARLSGGGRDDAERTAGDDLPAQPLEDGFRARVQLIAAVEVVDALDQGGDVDRAVFDGHILRHQIRLVHTAENPEGFDLAAGLHQHLVEEIHQVDTSDHPTLLLPVPEHLLLVVAGAAARREDLERVEFQLESLCRTLARVDQMPETHRLTELIVPRAGLRVVVDGRAEWRRCRGIVQGTT